MNTKYVWSFSSLKSRNQIVVVETVVICHCAAVNVEPPFVTLLFLLLLLLLLLFLLLLFSTCCCCWCFCCCCCYPLPYLPDIPTWHSYLTKLGQFRNSCNVSFHCQCVNCISYVGHLNWVWFHKQPIPAMI